MSRTPAARSHSFSGSMVKAAWTRPAATKASALAMEYMGRHRAGLGERRPSVAPEFPRIDHDDGIEVRSGREGDACAVQEQSASAHRGEEFVGRGIEDRGDDRYASFDQRGRNAELRYPIHQGLCAVDGVHDPDARVGESSRIVGGLFREPSILWKLPALHLMQDSVDLVIHGGDRRTVRFRLHLEPSPDQFTHLRAGVPDRFD